MYPTDPALWNATHVRHWIQWAIKEFKLVGVDQSRFDSMTGQMLCGLKHEEFVQLIPNDTSDIFWTHLELLRKCKFVGRCTVLFLSGFLLLMCGNLL